MTSLGVYLWDVGAENITNKGMGVWGTVLFVEDSEHFSVAGL